MVCFRADLRIWAAVLICNRSQPPHRADSNPRPREAVSQASPRTSASDGTSPSGSPAFRVAAGVACEPCAPVGQADWSAANSAQGAIHLDVKKPFSSPRLCLNLSGLLWCCCERLQSVKHAGFAGACCRGKSSNSGTKRSDSLLRPPRISWVSIP